MKKVLLLVVGLILAGCNAGTTHIVAQDFQSIDVRRTDKSNTNCDIVIPFLLIAGPAGSERSSIIGIAKQGSIGTITYADYYYTGIFPFFMKKCYTVYGY